MNGQSMSEERLAEIRATAEQYRGSLTVRNKPNGAIAHRGELLAELERLRAHLVAEQLATEAAETENDQLRAQLADLETNYTLQRKRQPAKCGTRPGYNKHLRLGEDPCADCRRAHAREHLQWKTNRTGRDGEPTDAGLVAQDETSAGDGSHP